jgi:hypothetical protein
MFIGVSVSDLNISRILNSLPDFAVSRPPDCRQLQACHRAGGH